MTGKRRVWSSVLDGVGCAVVLQLLAEYACSVYLFAVEADFERDMVQLSVLCVICAVLSAAAFWRLICRERDDGWLLARFAISAVGAGVSYGVILLVLKLVLRVSLLPLRPLGNADGLIILWAAAMFTTTSFVLRLLVGLVQLLANRRRRKHAK